MITLLPDASFLTIITLRLIQRLALLYGFEARDGDQRIEMWKAAAAASGIDYGKDLAGKQVCEKVAPRVARLLAAKLGTETAEKWVGRMVPLASSVIGGGVNFFFLWGWGRRGGRHFGGGELVAKASPRPPSPAGKE